MSRDEKTIVRALSVRQPFAELILRGMKTVEYRSRPTRIVGERFYLYASGKWAVGSGRSAVTSIAVSSLAADSSPVSPLPWMRELADGLRLFPRDLPTGLIVGVATIERISLRDDGMWAWHLRDVARSANYRKPTGHPQPVWFRPF